MEKIGKYKIYEDDKTLKVHYCYSLSDFTGALWYFVILTVGLFFFYVTFYQFDATKFTSWLYLIISISITGFGTFVVLGGLYNPRNGIFQYDKIKQIVIIRDFLKSKKIEQGLIYLFTYEVIKTKRPPQCYAMLLIKLKDGTKKECFILRSSISTSTEAKLEKDIHIISRRIRDRLTNSIIQK